MIPKHGQWPVDPQDAEAIRDDRIWIDGCFDFFHHGIVQLSYFGLSTKNAKGMQGSCSKLVNLAKSLLLVYTLTKTFSSIKGQQS